MKNKIKLIYKIFLAFLLTDPCVAQNLGPEITYNRGDTLEMVIPRVFEISDLGKAYPRTVTGLNGKQIVRNKVRTKVDTSVHVLFYKFEDGLFLNAWGTGLGMTASTLPVDTNIRRAQLTIMRILKSDELAESQSSERHQNFENPLMLVGIDYGNSFNLSISGPKTHFTNQVYWELEEAISKQEPIEPILAKYDLSGTRALRGIRSKTGSQEIPTSWEDLKTKYHVKDPIPVFGRYELLKDLDAQTTMWLK